MCQTNSSSTWVNVLRFGLSLRRNAELREGRSTECIAQLARSEIAIYYVGVLYGMNCPCVSGHGKCGGVNYSLMSVRDNFTKEWIAESFNRSVFVYRFDEGNIQRIVDRVHPDVVIFAGLETTVEDLVRYSSLTTERTMWGNMFF